VPTAKIEILGPDSPQNDYFQLHSFFSESAQVLLRSPYSLFSIQDIHKVKVH